MDGDVLRAACEYAARGWSIIPMRISRDEKKPACKWKSYQRERASEEKLVRWFGRHRSDYWRNVNGLGVVFAEASGGLASRDFDDMHAYRRWAQANPVLAAELPTVETRRGRHVYFLVEPTRMAALRRQIGKPDGTGAIACSDGELRAGVGCYSALPPSQRPECEPYRWVVPLPDGDLPVVDVVEAGLFSIEAHEVRTLKDVASLIQRRAAEFVNGSHATESTETTETTETTEDYRRQQTQ